MSKQEDGSPRFSNGYARDDGEGIRHYKYSEASYKSQFRKKSNEAGIYIHIPFCKQACHYCDFHFSTNTSSQDSMMQCINKELIIRQTYLPTDTTIQSIYFGGGTPSLVKAKHIERIINNIFTTYKVKQDVEITLEVNPDDVTKKKLTKLKQAGINRLSIGIQSFDDTNLKYLNRAHNKAKAIKSVSIARDLGFDNISIDLIYSIPASNKSTWISDLEIATSLAPNHISAYSLTIEKNTFFGKLKDIGKLKPVNEDESAQQFEILVQTLEDKKYEHYEISNFCLDKQYSTHNRNYWAQKPYIGIGPGAHSYDLKSRQYNIYNNKKYIEGINKGRVPFYKETLTNKQIINEYIMTTIRTQWGTDTKKLLAEHNYDLTSHKKEPLKYMFDKQLIRLADGVLFLERKGKLLADKITQELFID
jgi:oxygen-independent coproporphyrinogen-3 oxidase